jgi:hypothetical protein
VDWIVLFLAASICLTPGWASSRSCESSWDRPNINAAIVACMFDADEDACVERELYEDHCCC